MKVGYLGPKATFTHTAVLSFFQNGEETKAYQTIPSCIDGLLEGEIDYAVVPLENALEGSVSITLDYIIHEVTCTIVGELILPIRQHLMMHPSQATNALTKITKVFSHPHAIGQCHRYLHQTIPTVHIVQQDSTSTAAAFVASHSDECYAAIANEMAAQTYGLEIVVRDIHSHNSNHTRFIILSKETYEPKKAYLGQKTTLWITVPEDSAGALHQILSTFAWRKLNLSKIESRPMKTGLGNYFFIIDVEVDETSSVLLQGAIDEIHALGCTVNSLGSYKYYLLD